MNERTFFFEMIYISTQKFQFANHLKCVVAILSENAGTLSF